MMALTKKQIGLTVAAVVVIVAAIGARLTFGRFAASADEAYVYIDADDTADSVYVKLSAQASAPKLAALRCCCALSGYSGRVHTGRYAVGGGVSTFTLWRNLRGGRQEPVGLVIPVAHTMNDLAGKLSRQLQTDSLTLCEAFSDSLALAEYGVTKETAPCLFIPNTYEVYWDITPRKLLQRMKREHDAFWTDARRAKARAAGLTADQAYTLASIVEQESANESERSMIAGMYINRLNTGMKLQADPTVKFALQDFGLRRILLGHLSADSPYNTYRHEGLPPGPICIPSLNAINSVLDYTHHSYLYMCAKEDFSGTHNFAATYAEHQANAARYARALNEHGVK